MLTILTAPPGLARWRKTTTALPALSLLVALVALRETLLSAWYGYLGLCRALVSPSLGDERLSSRDRARILVECLGRWTRCEVDIESLRRTY